MSSKPVDTKAKLIAAAFKLIELEGDAHFATRAVCEIAQVKAPTLYHHFGSIDGLLNAVIGEAFEQFLAAKRAVSATADPVQALVEGWNIYVEFASERPRLYAAMMARFLSGADLPAAREGQEMLRDRVAKIEAAGLLAVPPEAAVKVVWSSVNAAALLFLAAKMQPSLAMEKPDATILARIRDSALQAIYKSA